MHSLYAVSVCFSNATVSGLGPIRTEPDDTVRLRLLLLEYRSVQSRVFVQPSLLPMDKHDSKDRYFSKQSMGDETMRIFGL